MSHNYLLSQHLSQPIWWWRWLYDSVTEEGILLQDSWLPGMNQLPKDPLTLTGSARGVGPYRLCDYFPFVKNYKAWGM